MKVMRSLAAGIGIAFRRWPLILPAYLTQLLLALLASSPAAYLLYRLIDRREVARHSVTSLPGFLMTDTFSLHPQGPAQAIALAIPILGVAALYLVLAPVLRAGTMAALAAPKGASLGYAFWTGIHRLGLPYLRLGLLLLPIWGVAVGIGLFLGALSSGVVLAVTPSAAWRVITVAVPVVLFGVVQTWAEYTRIALIDAHRPRVWQALVTAWLFIWRQPGKAAGLTLAMLLLGWALVAGALAVEWQLPVGESNWLLLLLWQQAVILVRIWTQHATLAAYLHLYRTNP